VIFLTATFVIFYCYFCDIPYCYFGNFPYCQDPKKWNIDVYGDSVRVEMSILEEWLPDIDIPFTISTNLMVQWDGFNAMDFMYKVFGTSNFKSLQCQQNEPHPITKFFMRMTHCGNLGNLPTLKVKREHKDAVLPTKSRMTDQGFDVTIISKFKDLGDNTALWDTGIAISPDYGYYVDLLPRSSISKTGYIMVNSVGVIDQSYRGTLKVALFKVDPSKPDMEEILPFRITQMVLRRAIHYNVVEVDDLDQTERSDKGFGSSGTK
jgi:deoxyuridine 5'-triphosphate nucleotidohydrolase